METKKTAQEYFSQLYHESLKNGNTRERAFDIACINFELKKNLKAPYRNFPSFYRTSIHLRKKRLASLKSEISSQPHTNQK